MDKEWQKLEKISAWNLGCDSTFCIIDKSLSSEECGTTEETSVIQRSSCTLKRYRERRFKLLCSIHRVTIISITNDSRKVMDIISRLLWTRRASSRRGIGLHPSKNGRFSEVVEYSQIGMSRHLDTSADDTNGLNHGPQYKARVAIWGDMVKDGSDSHSQSNDHQYHKWPLQKSWISFQDS